MNRKCFISCQSRLNLLYILKYSRLFKSWILYLRCVMGTEMQYHNNCPLNFVHTVKKEFNKNNFNKIMKEFSSFYLLICCGNSRYSIKRYLISIWISIIIPKQNIQPIFDLPANMICNYVNCSTNIFAEKYFRLCKVILAILL